MDHKTEQDAGLLEQGASMLEEHAEEQRARGNCSAAEGAACSAHAIRRLAPAMLRAGHGCLAQIEEPAQPVAEICSASHDDAEFGERAIKPLRDISGFDYGTPLYAGAAPAAVAAPAREEIAALRAEHGITSNGRGIKEFEQVDAFVRAVLQRWGAAPALEAPAAPAGDEEAAFKKWFQGEQGKPYQGMWEFACAAWMARAAAPQAPAALDELRQIADIAACWGCDHPDEPGDTELLRRVKWAARQLRAVSQAPAAPSIAVVTDEQIDAILDSPGGLGMLIADKRERMRMFARRVLDLAAPAAPAVDASPLIARNLAEWHEDDGDVSWWAWCGNGWAGEPAWIGRPTDDGWPGYHTHWTAHPAMPPAIAAQAAAKGEHDD